MTKALTDFKALNAPARSSTRPTMVPQWNDAIALVIQGKAAANVMGDWAGGEFSVPPARRPAPTMSAGLCRPTIRWSPPAAT